MKRFVKEFGKELYSQATQDLLNGGNKTKLLTSAVIPASTKNPTISYLNPKKEFDNSFLDNPEEKSNLPITHNAFNNIAFEVSNKNSIANEYIYVRHENHELNTQSTTHLQNSQNAQEVKIDPIVMLLIVAILAGAAYATIGGSMA